ncbi:MAG TPA: molybdopterin-synthase adenylyltransferase MoeB [Verrucomicrobiae bacterium]|nr:molybdopterin-synthase adenylyltransferase MoeB [Verrucomicrobiae bacterium]
MSHLDRINEAFAGVSLSGEEIHRYGRHLVMPEITIDGQRKLKAARVLCVGTGGLGSPLLTYLAAAGIGKLGIVDFDFVDHSNLHRQIIHSTESIGQPKVVSARKRIHEINPNVEVETHEVALRSGNAMGICRGYDVIVDGTDNFPARYLVNDTCALLGKPNVYGSIFRFEGQCTVFWATKGPCYRCLFPDPPPPGLVPSCAEGGVLGVLPGIIGVMQAIETIKIILGIGDPLIGRLVAFDALRMRFRELKLPKDPACPICGEKPTIRELIDYEQFCGAAATAGTTAPKEAPVPEITATELSARLAAKKDLILLDVREPHEYQICRIPGARLIPLGELSRKIHEFDPDQEILIHCKSGGRSATAVRAFQKAGFRHVKNVRGGILAWSKEVDPTVPRY